MAGIEQHLNQLKRQHAAEIRDLRESMDKQSIQAEDLLAQLQVVQAEGQQARRSADSSRTHISIIEQKLAAAKADLSTANSECAGMQARLQETNSKVQMASAAAKLAADKEINLQQQIGALKQKVASSTDEQDVLRWQSRLEQAHDQIAGLQQEKQKAETKALQLDRLKEQFFGKQQEIAKQHLQHEELLTALSHSQAEQQQLQEQINMHIVAKKQIQAHLEELTRQKLHQQQQLALAAEQIAEINRQLDDSQQAATALQQQLDSVKAHADAQSASRQHAEQQLGSSKAQLQEQTNVARSLVEKLDNADSCGRAKDQEIKLLKEQVQQMQALVAQTKAAKQGAKQTEVQLAASAEQLANKDQEIAALRGQVEALQRQHAQVAILEAALASSETEVQKKEERIAALEKLLAGKQDDLDHQQAKQEQQQSQAASLQSAMDTLQRQLDAASNTHRQSQEQLSFANSTIRDYNQKLKDLQVLLASSKATQQSSSQSILALQESAAHQAAALTASEAQCQKLLSELDVKDEQLKQALAKLQAAEHAAVAAQDAANKLRHRLTMQQAEAGDQSRDLTEALDLGSSTVQQLEATVQALQDKMFAAEHAMESQQQQLSSQQAAASDASKQVEQLTQQLSNNNNMVTSLQTALTTANFVAESNQELVSSLQASCTSQQADASQQVRSLVAQLQLQASKSGELMAELSSSRCKQLAADQAVAAGQEKLLDTQQELSIVAGRVTFLTQLLERREQREWLAKTQSSASEVAEHEVGGDFKQNCEEPEQRVLLSASIQATRDSDVVATPLKDASNTALADKLVDNQMDTAPAKLAEKSCSLRGSMARQTITTPNTKQVEV